MTDAKAAEQLRDWAAQRFGNLKPAEARLLKKAPTGDVCDVSSGDEAKDNPAAADEWDDDRVVRAELIRGLCVDQDASTVVDVKGIQLIGARIVGVLDLEDAKISFGLHLIRCRICEPMTLLGAEVWRVVLSGSHTRSIALDGAIVHQDVFLKDGFTAHGEVRLIGASIGGSLVCTGGTFKGGKALNAHRMTVNGSVFLDNDFTAKGDVGLHGASIDGNLDCTGGRFESEGRNAFLAENITVKGALFLRNDFSVSGSMSLAGASVGTLLDEKDAWPGRMQDAVILDGFTYNAISGGAPTDATFRIRWLELQDQKKDPEDQKKPGFLPKPYEQLAKVLREMGHPSDAKTVMIAKEEARRKYGNMKRWAKRWHWLIGATIGYGYRTQLAARYLVVLLLAGWLLFSLGSSAGLMRPTDAEGVAKAGFFQTVATGEGTPSLIPIVYSLDALVPIVDLHQQRFWLPMAREFSWGFMLRIYLWLHIAAGWFFSTMVVIGVTGIARPG